LNRTLYVKTTSRPSVLFKNHQKHNNANPFPSPLAFIPMNCASWTLLAQYYIFGVLYFRMAFSDETAKHRTHCILRNSCKFVIFDNLILKA